MRPEPYEKSSGERRGVSPPVGSDPTGGLTPRRSPDDLSCITNRTWDIVVVGAGLAGSLAARGLARCGVEVLLLDRAVFPRWKVCGCCLNPLAQSTLSAVGLGTLSAELGAVPLQVMQLASRGVQARLDLPGWLSLSRQRLDTALVVAAQKAGAQFAQGVQARLGPAGDGSRTLWVRTGTGSELQLSARLILAADGLGGRFLADGLDVQRGTGAKAPPGEQPIQVSADSRIGAGVVADSGPAFYAPGTVYMAHGRGGYLGLVRLEDDRLNLAAAFDAPFLRFHHPGRAAVQLLREVGWPVWDGLAELRWRGTPTLTRRPLRPGTERVLALGDAAGYVEPFTGEGMAWALASGAAVVPLAQRAAQAWQPTLVEEWTRLHRHIVTRRQWVCWAMAWLTRHPSLTRLVVAALGRLPWLATPFLHQIGAAAPLP